MLSFSVFCHFYNPEDITMEKQCTKTNTLHKTLNFVTFTAEFLNGKLHFCTVLYV